MKIRGNKLELNNVSSIRLDSFWYGYIFALTFRLWMNNQIKSIIFEF